MIFFLLSLVLLSPSPPGACIDKIIWNYSGSACSCLPQNLTEKNSHKPKSCSSLQSNGAWAFFHSKGWGLQRPRWKSIGKSEQEPFLIKRHRWLWTSCLKFQNQHSCDGKSDVLTPRADHLPPGASAVELFLVWEVSSANVQVWALSQVSRSRGGTMICSSAAPEAAGPRHLRESSICYSEQHAAQRDLQPRRCWLLTFRHLLLPTRELDILVPPHTALPHA